MLRFKNQSEAKRAVAAATSEIELAVRRIETLFADWAAFVGFEANVASAIELTYKLEAEYPITLPLLIGQAFLLRDGLGRAAADAARTSTELEAEWARLITISADLAIAEAGAKPGEVVQRAERAEKLAGRLPVLEGEMTTALEHVPIYHQVPMPARARGWAREGARAAKLLRHC